MKRAKAICAILAIATVLLSGSTYAQQSSSTGQQDTKGKSSQNTNTQTAATSGTTLNGSDREFLMKAAHSSMAEVVLGRLAVERASSDEVKQYGQHMIDDHSRANTELLQLASNKGVALPAGHAEHTGQMTAAQNREQNREVSNTTGNRTDNTKAQDATGTNRNTQSQQTRTQDQTATSGQNQDASSMPLDSKHEAVRARLMKLSGEEFDREYMRQMVKDHNAAVSLFQKQANNGKDADVRAFAAKTLPALQEHLRQARDLEQRVKNAGKTKTSSQQQQ